MGVAVCARPDAIALHFGHNAVWDQRLDESHVPHVGRFDEVFGKVRAIDPDASSLSEDPWYADYKKKMGASYRRPFPRPFPCGVIIIGFDQRRCEVLGYDLAIADGRLAIRLLVDGQEAQACEIFVDQHDDRLWLRWTGAESIRSCCINRIRVMPDPSTPKEFPAPQPWEHRRHKRHGFGFRQVLPGRAPETDLSQRLATDRAFRLDCWATGVGEPAQEVSFGGLMWDKGPLWRAWTPPVKGTFTVVCELMHGDASHVPSAPTAMPPEPNAFNAAFDHSRRMWCNFWERSAIACDDVTIEAIWYRHLYFFHCACRQGQVAPGLFANWSYDGIGSVWHGDYHLNYNLQQPFWICFATNHLEHHLPYVQLVENLLPIARSWANDFYGMHGAAFPHSAYPVPMSFNPFPDPSVGWEICETPWAVHPLWQHYLAGMDPTFLRERAYPLMREAILFLLQFLTRDDARDEEGTYHVFPSVAPELYLLRPGLKHNRDCFVTLVMTRRLIADFQQACAVLDIEDDERQLLERLENLAANLAPLPTGETRSGPVYLPEPDSHAEVVQNLPITNFAVFPGGLDDAIEDPADLELNRRTYRLARNEGGNDIVIRHMQAARLGLLDLQRFKRRVDYNALPNGAPGQRVLSTGGRYNDAQSFDFMHRAGIWFENTALPAVLAEGLMQSWRGFIEVFPCWSSKAPTRFRDLRAQGAFLVSSARRADGVITGLRIRCEAGGKLRLKLPWPAVVDHRERRRRAPAGMLILDTQPDDIVECRPIARGPDSGQRTRS